MVVWTAMVVVGFSRPDGGGEQYFIFPSDLEFSLCNQQSRLRLAPFDAAAAPETETLFRLQSNALCPLTFLSSPRRPSFPWRLRCTKPKLEMDAHEPRHTASGIFLYFFPRFPLLGRFYLSPPRAGKFVLANYFSATKFGTYRADSCLDRLVYFHFSRNFARFPKIDTSFLNKSYDLSRLFDKFAKYMFGERIIDRISTRERYTLRWERVFMGRESANIERISRLSALHGTALAAYLLANKGGRVPQTTFISIISLRLPNGFKLLSVRKRNKRGV